MRRPSIAAAAALVAAVFLSLASGAPPRPVGAAGSSAPAFPFAGALREARAGAPRIFALSGDFRPRSISRAAVRGGSGYLGWDAASKALRLFDPAGKVLGSWPMDAAFVWVSWPFALARGKSFEEGTGDGRGFEYALYRFDGGPRRAWRATLDCFPSDVAFAPDGTVYLAGADRNDAEHAVYLIDASAKPRRLLAAKKKSDFMRIVDCDGAMLAFASARDPAAEGLEFYYRAPGSKAFSRIAATGLPADARCAFGYGFAFGKGFVVPLALAGGDLALARLEVRDGVLRAASVARGAKGCYLPLGPDPDGSSYRYLAREAGPKKESFFLGRYDGSSAALEKID